MPSGEGSRSGIFPSRNEELANAKWSELDERCPITSSPGTGSGTVAVPDVVVARDLDMCPLPPDAHIAHYIDDILIPGPMETAVAEAVAAL
eukprot:g41527.t1